MKERDRRSVAQNSASVENSEKSLVTREQRDKSPKKKRLVRGFIAAMEVRRRVKDKVKKSLC